MSERIIKSESATDGNIIIVRGGTPLYGEIDISPSKNAILPIIAATLLAEGDTCIPQVPDLSDVRLMCEVISHLGGEVNRRGYGVVFNNDEIDQYEPPYELVRKMRASILVMGPLLARWGRVTISMPGGCAIGTRPIDFHLKGLAAMGASINLSGGKIEARAPGLNGAAIYLDFPSVGATENIMMAAALARGMTVIENAALEPEIQALAEFINAMGGKVRGAGTSLIKIEGVRQLKGTTHAIIPDRIEAGTYMVAAAAAGGEVIINQVIPEHLKAVTAKLRETGIEIDDSIPRRIHIIARGEQPKPIYLKTMPYPGFSTDMQPQFTALLATAQGTSLVNESIFDNRFLHVRELARMGANIRVENRTAVIHGVKSLTGAQVAATDLRAGAALVIAALGTSGKTIISGCEHIDRGYENLIGKLISLGASMERYNTT
ncbi:MAG: UDP-N-acetylglucosamine 1-carboxyvinyltransferase [Syntrophothermaceae bacterium]|jgi:UDP-N-acetylglucosamine 1-carboxyvinyltransferase